MLRKVSEDYIEFKTEQTKNRRKQRDKKQFFKRISRKCRLNPHCNHAQLMRKMQLRSSFKKH